MRNAFLLLILLTTLIVLSGCLGRGGAEAFAKNLPEVQEFLEQNPDAEIRAGFWPVENVGLFIKDIRAECGGQMQEQDYWIVTITKETENVKIYLDESGEKALCIIRKGTPTEPTEEPQEPETPDETQPEDEDPPVVEQPQDACNSNSECNDNNPCTTDSCTGSPKECSYSQKTSCSGGDNCCPLGCANASDSDCPTTDECQTNNDCYDTDNSTTDTCTGSPKTCQNTLKTCSQRSGDICSSDETCSKSYISSLDSSKCCPTTCTTTDPCAGVSCSSDKKCVSGACVLKTCSERGGNTCTGEQTCSGSTVTTSDSSTCCLGSCVSTDPCAYGGCTCAEAGGASCVQGQTCSGSHISATDCGIGEDCYFCCAGPCEGEPLYNCGRRYNCNENQNCINDRCVIKTCAEQGGVSCQNGEKCNSWIDTLDKENCCGTACEKITVSAGSYLECQEISSVSYSGSLASGNAFTILPHNSEVMWGQIRSTGWESYSAEFPSTRNVSIMPPDNMLVSNSYQGGTLTLNCDGETKSIKVPNFVDIGEDGFIDENDKFFEKKMYVGADGTTYYDSDLTIIAK